MFICPVEYYPNCRVHDSGYYHSVKFFKTLDALMSYALEDKDEFSLSEIYNEKGEDIGLVRYEFDAHNVTNIFIDLEEFQASLIDNGHGKLIWREYYDD